MKYLDIAGLTSSLAKLWDKVKAYADTRPGPQGPPGQDGAPGAKGDKGDTGASFDPADVARITALENTVGTLNTALQSRLQGLI